MSATKLYKELAEITMFTCANCYQFTTTRVHIGSIEGFVFCSNECGLEAMKRNHAKGVK